MKRITLIFLIALAASVCTMAQQFENESEYYPKSFQIHKIYTHTLGFRIDYIKQDYSIDTLWAPIEWFRSTAGSGSMAYGDSLAYPYITFYFKNGELNHFRLYLIESKAHSSWGVLSALTDYSEKFPSPDSAPVFEL